MDSGPAVEVRPVPESNRVAITVAIPTMNGTRHLPECLRSVLDQGLAVADWIVADDRSDDETPALVREIAGDRVRVSVNSERLGLAGNWNRCVSLCRTAHIAIVHQDDRLRPGHVAAHAEAFAANLTIGLVASATTVIDENGRDVPETVVGRGGLGPVDQRFGPGEAVPALAEVNPLRCSAVSMRVGAQIESGGFDPSLRYAVDWDFWLKIARAYPVVWLARPTVDVRWHLASETHRFARGTLDLEESARVMNANFAWMRSQAIETDRVHSLARKRLARAYLNRAYVAARSGNAPLGRQCVWRAIRLWKGVIRAIARDPKLAILMAAVTVAPEMTGNWLSRKRASSNPLRATTIVGKNSCAKGPSECTVAGRVVGFWRAGTGNRSH